MNNNTNQDIILEEKIHSLLAPLKPEQIELIDESWKHVGHAGVKERGGRHYKLIIQSKILNEEYSTLIKQHKKIYTLLADLMHKDIHALSIKVRS